MFRSPAHKINYLYTIARKMVAFWDDIPALSRDDLIQAAIAAVLEELDRHDPTKAQIVTFIERIMYWRIRDEIRRVTGKRYNRPAVIALADLVEDSDRIFGDRDPRFDRVNDRDELMTLLAGLSRREKLVLWLQYGEGLKLKEIGALLEVTPSRVWQIQTEAMKRARNKGDKRDGEKGTEFRGR